MTWEYALIGFIIGVVIGALAMRYGNRKLREQRSLQYELEKTKSELADHRNEVNQHFAKSAEMLDTMAHDYRQLYQHMAKGASELLPGMSGEDNPFALQSPERNPHETEPQQIEMPRDYPDSATGLLRGENAKAEKN
ncbi:MAG: Inner membrane protein YhcB [Candidatus Erwinia impunctatus]|nr:Inner membrane protein YhcB [Culicoides impunctatus]